MQELLGGLFAEIAPLLARAVAAVVFTLLGGAMGLSAVGSLVSGGEVLFALWAFYMGGIAIYAGVFVFGTQLLDRVSPNQA